MDDIRISVEDVRKKRDAGEVVHFVDTRNPQAWAESNERLPGAVRVPLADVEEQADQLPRGSTIVAYCT
ncbi:MAG: rhodanese-like domain-containing protein [Fimbriimonadales bacterium]